MQTYEELSRFRAAMDMCGDAIYLVDRATMRFVDVNHTACTRMGYSREELLQRGPQDLLGASREEIERAYDKVIAAGANGITSESSARTKDGRASVTELHRRALHLEKGWLIVSIARDITERKRAEQALRESEAELRLLTENVPAMILYFDPRMNCVFANQYYADFFGLTVTDLVGKPLREIIGDTVFPDLEAHFRKALEGAPVAYQREVRLKSGEQRYIEVKLVPRVADQRQILGCYSMVIDITEQKQTEGRIRYLATHDSLTGLPNRLLFNDRLGQAISLAKRDACQFALLYLDLDGFKPVNDTLGHSVGDQVLNAVAERLRNQVRESDTVARIGGDEFTVILRDISSPQDVAAVSQKIIAAFAAPFCLGTVSEEIKIGASIGIAVYPGDAQDHEALIGRADAAMYNAKAQGNCFRFSGILVP